MVRNGYAFWAHDFRGHGRSAGKRGHVDNFDDYLADLSRLTRIAKEKDPASKTFLYGHSLGGLVVLDYAEKHGSELAGVISTSPLLGLRMKVSPLKTFLGKTLSSIVPTFTLSTGLDPNLLSHRQEIVQSYVSDALVHGVATARFYTEFLRATKETIDSAGKLKLPCLIMQAGADGIVDAAVTTAFFKQVGSADKTLKVYDAWYHEIQNEPGWESVVKDIDAWVLARI
jgi:alpha-beta hydrolase superfamily lysophospholipase